MEPPVEIRDLARNELSRIGEIDRTERIDVRFEQHGTELVARRGTWSAPVWDPDGHGEHSVDAQHRALVHDADEGGIARGAFSNGRLVGIGVVVPHIGPAIAQLAHLHVSQDFQSAGIGSRHYLGPWRLPGPDSHWLAVKSLRSIRHDNPFAVKAQRAAGRT